ncbi:MAG: YigZ family protein [Clostridia bacterium]|nr:YigZ family protein [Clostridia bacterium]
MGRYLTVLGSSQAEYVEKRSRFIASLKQVKTEEEAISFIEEIRSKYWDARHNCFAYSVEGGKYSRFSDDGEPHGTAGKPILEVINGNEINDVVIVVTRYFGGVLLGTGGLVRAYGKASKDALENAKKAEMIPCTLYETTCEYSDHQILTNLIENSGGEIRNTDFTDKVKVSYVFKDNECNLFLDKLTETFSARLNAFETEKTVFPFEI